MQMAAITKQDKEIFRTIFLENWDDFKDSHPAYDCEQYEEPVKKMLNCGKESGGYCEYICMKCGRDLRRVCFSCKSCFCLSCAKVYADNMVCQVSKMLHPGVIYRHCILTVPKQLRQVFYDNRHDGKLLSAFMRTGYQCLEDVVSTVKGRVMKIGAIMVVQTLGRSGRYNPHLHVILTDGGISIENKKWVSLGYFPYDMIHKKWQYYLLNMISEVLGVKVKNLVSLLWKQYPKGFVAHVTKGKVPKKCKGLARYLAKYVASPPIAVSRIVEYDGKNVTYWYRDHKSKAKKVETIPVFIFIGRMVQHVLVKGFKRVRYYGLQATKSFSKWCEIIKAGIRKIGKVVKGAYEIVSQKKYQERYRDVTGNDPFVCKYCGGGMILWKIWHPNCGYIFDEEEQIKQDKYGVKEWFEERDRSPVRSTTRGIQLPLFPVPVRDWC
jgi:hypothetical protein